MRDQLVPLLESLGAQVQISGSALNVSMRMGAQKQTRTIDTANLSNDRAYLANFARGIFAVVNEPANSKGGELSFLDSTPSVMPVAFGPGFLEGIHAAGGEAPFVQRYVGELQLAYFVDLDEGQRLLPASQVVEWGVHPERVEKAGLSILFHRSGWERWENHLIDGVLVRRLVIGDGADGARGTLMEFFDWQKAQSGRFFAAPSSELLLFSDDTTDETLAVFKRVVEGAFDKHELPLSRSVFRFVSGRIDPSFEA